MSEIEVVAYDAPWAKAWHVFVSPDESSVTQRVPLEVQTDVGFLAIAVSGDAIDVLGLPPGAHLTVRNPQSEILQRASDKQDLFTLFAADDLVNGVVVDPQEGQWELEIRNDEDADPFSVIVAASKKKYKKRKRRPKPRKPAASKAPAPGTRFRCTACKATATALALSITAVVSATAIPAALITSVAAFLGGVTTIAATAFISSMIGSSATFIADALCRQVGLCP